MRMSTSSGARPLTPRRLVPSGWSLDPELDTMDTNDIMERRS